MTIHGLATHSVDVLLDLQETKELLLDSQKQVYFRNSKNTTFYLFGLRPLLELAHLLLVVVADLLLLGEGHNVDQLLAEPLLSRVADFIIDDPAIIEAY